MSTLSDHLLVRLFKAFPATDTIFKPPGPRAAAEYESECELPFHRWLKAGPEMFADQDVLDLGCGFGGRAVRFQELGARVTGVEIDEELVAQATEFARAKGSHARFVVGTGEQIPCADSSYDLITMFDVMEHVIDPRAVLQECYRVLRPGGRAAIVFPPYYDVTAGSHLHGYATRFPGLNLLFSTKALKSAAAMLLTEQGVNYRAFLREVPTDKLWNQNGLTVRGFRRLVRNSDFRVARFDCLGHMSARLSRHSGVALFLRRFVYFVPTAVARIPFVQEIFCARVVAILSK